MRRVNGILGLVMLGGCVSGNVETAPPVSVRATQECAPESYPEDLPAATALVDTAGLSAALRALADSIDDVRGRVVLTMAYQEDGLNMRRDILTHDLTPVVADSIQELVFANRLTLPEASQEWGVRLQIDLDEPIAYRVERREYCPPRPRDMEIESAIATYMGTGLRYSGGQRVRTVVVRLTIHPSGYVDGGSVVRGGSTGSPLEQDIVTFLRQYSFVPATIDGAPTYGYVDVPVRVRG